MLLCLQHDRIKDRFANSEREKESEFGAGNAGCHEPNGGRAIVYFDGLGLPAGHGCGDVLPHEKKYRRGISNH